MSLSLSFVIVIIIERIAFMEPYFDHEKLRVYQESLKFVEWNEQILKKLQKSCLYGAN